MYLKLPEGVLGTSNKVWKLRKSLYSLKTAARCWYKTLQDALLEMGLKKNEHESCLYFKHEGNLVTVILVYVDDMILTGNNSEFLEFVRQELTKKFEIKDEGEPQKFLGLQIQRNRELGIENITNKFLKDVKRTSTPMEVNLKLVYSESPKTALPFRELIGALIAILHMEQDQTSCLRLTT